MTRADAAVVPGARDLAPRMRSEARLQTRDPRLRDRPSWGAISPGDVLVAHDLRGSGLDTRLSSRITGRSAWYLR